MVEASAGESGWIQIPDKVDLQTPTVIEADLTRSDIQNLTHLLNSAADTLLASSYKEEQYPQHDQGFVNRSRSDHGSSEASGSSTKQIFLEKLSDGLKRKAQSNAQPSSRGVDRQGSFEEVFRTDAEVHENNPVDAIAHTPLLEGLPTGSGKTGWLVTSSQSMLNLWECCSGKAGPELQLMHSQMTDFDHRSFRLDTANKLLVSASQETLGLRKEWLALYSLDVQIGMLAPRGQLPLPPRNFSASARPPSTQDTLQVESLSGLGGPLKTCAAANFGRHITIYPITSGVNASPKISWQAHSAAISQLHCSSYSVDLYSAAIDGSISRWSLRDKPRAAAATFKGVSDRIQGLHQISEHQLLGATSAGGIYVWDVRKPDNPMLRNTVPHSGILQIAVNREKHIGAASSKDGLLYTFSLSEAQNFCECVPVFLKRKLAAVKSLQWNSKAECLYAASGGSLAVFRCNGTLNK